MHIGKNTHVCVVCFHRSSWTDVYQTFSKYRPQCGLHNKIEIEIATVGSRDVAMVIDMWRVSAKIDIPRFYSVRWRSTTDGRIATWILH